MPALLQRLQRAAVPVILTALAAGVLWGCVAQAPPNTDWATPLAGEPSPADGDEIQKLFDAYGQSLVDKNREQFLSTLDPASSAFYARQQEIFSRLAAVPFSQYRIALTGQTETAPGAVTAKVTIAYTLMESFPGLPDPERAAFSLVKGEGGWKLSGDATEQALGRKRNARLEDFGPVEVLSGQHVMALYHPADRPVAERVTGQADAGWPRLESALPGISLPKVSVTIFDSQQQINLAFPGQWQEWTGGASRQLGPLEEQGGEIIIDADLYNEVGAGDPDYNRKMIAHELTHVALFPQSGPTTPPFLVEGLADFVAGEETVVLLQGKLRRGEPFSPTLKDLYQPGSFSALLSAEAAQLAYEQADTAVAYLEKKYGNESVFDLLKEFKRRESEATDQSRMVDEVFKSVLGTGWSDFERDWRQYVLGG